MDTLIAAFAAFALVMLGMAVGVIFSNRRLKGTCGGLNTMQDDFGRPLCECGAPPGSCAESGEGEEAREREVAAG